MNNQKKPAISQSRFRSIREGLLILAAGAAAFLLLALVSYHHQDQGWSTTSSIAPPLNWGGLIGAWLADLLFCIFGYTAYIFPIILVFFPYLALYRQKPSLTITAPSTVLQGLGLIFMLISGCGLIGLCHHTTFLPFDSGGILGNLTNSLMTKFFNHIGTNVILTAWFLAGTTLFTGASWLSLIDRLGYFTLKLFEQGKSLLTEIPKSFKTITPISLSKVEPAINEPLKIRDNNDYRDKAPPITTNPDPFYSKQGPSNRLNLNWILPPLSLLDESTKTKPTNYSAQELEERSRLVELKLGDFGIAAQVVAVHPGPVVTRFELQPVAGTKASRITSLAKDLARSLSVTSVRIVEIIPGKSVIGLELPNDDRETVRLREILSAPQYQHSNAPLALALGKDIAGYPVVVDLSKMPHLLVAGTTGSGKSVCINALLMSLLYKYSPDDLRLILIDPKMLELSVYEEIPHLLAPVVTNMKESISVFRWCVGEMERRYRLMSMLGVRNLASYNHKLKEHQTKKIPLKIDQSTANQDLTQNEPQPLPYIVVIADEYSDMMMSVGKKVEELIARLAQKARAAGIHLILATQRPSVDVITGLIKANIPTRIAFQVSSKVDSRTILDQSGAEQLLGSGDMLYLPPGSGIPVRIHGSFVDDNEVHRVVGELKRRGSPQYLEEITLESEEPPNPIINGEEYPLEQDPLYDQAVQIVLESRRASVSGVQRRLKIGYNRAARIIEAMEAAKILGPMESNGNREILLSLPPPD